MRSCFAPLLLVLVIASGPESRGQGAVWPVDTTTSGQLGNALASGPELSGTGRYVTFQSGATNLVAGDTNGSLDLFIKDLESGTVERVNLTSQGTQTSAACYTSGHISEDGRFVVFNCSATDLVPNDTNGFHDVFIRDRQLGTTTRVVAPVTGQQGNGFSVPYGISNDARFIAFVSDATNFVPGDGNGFRDLFVYDAQTGQITLESRSSAGLLGNERVESASMSADGRFIAFSSRASNLVPNDTNGASDIFLRDRTTGTTVRVSETAAGVGGNNHSISPNCSLNGDIVTFLSISTNFGPSGQSAGHNVYVKSLNTGSLQLVNRTTGGTLANGPSLWSRMSGDGRYVVFTSLADNLSPVDQPLTNDLYLHDLGLGTTERLTYNSAGDPAQIPCIPFPPSQPCGGQYLGAAISLDASIVVFDHQDGALIPGISAGQSSHILATYIDCHLRRVNLPAIGATFVMSLDAPTSAFNPYLLALSLDWEPGVPFLTRHLPLNPDALFELSLSPSPLFQGFSGIMDGAGQAVASIQIPFVPSLIGLRFYAAYVTGNSGAVLGIFRVSNALRVDL